MLHYLVQIVIFQFLFLLVYELLLKRETFFSYNRVYLLLSPLIAIILPLLKLNFLQFDLPVAPLAEVLPEVLLGESGNIAAGGKELSEPSFWNFSKANLLWGIYGAGAISSVLVFLYKFRNIRKMCSLKVGSFGPAEIVEVPGSRIACTFFNTIVLGADLSEKERKQILSHELVHVREHHTLDLLYFELLKIIFWFNPLIYIYQSRITILHEFIADEGVVKSTEKKTYYQQLLNSAFATENISFINLFFNQSIIKKRIVMLQKTKSKNISKLKFLIVLPLMAVMLTYVACSEEKEINNDQVESSIDDPEAPSTMKSTKESNSSNSEKTDIDVPFAIIEQVPVFPGCEDLSSNIDRKSCFSEKITEHINQNFNTALGKEHGLAGVNRVYVQFRVSNEGSVELMGARAPHPALEEEAARVIGMLPDVVPGENGGKKVNVLYTVPITFVVEE